MTNYHDHCIEPTAPKSTPDSLVSTQKEISSKLDTIIENTTPEENNG